MSRSNSIDYVLHQCPTTVDDVNNPQYKHVIKFLEQSLGWSMANIKQQHRGLQESGKGMASINIQLTEFESNHILFLTSSEMVFTKFFRDPANIQKELKKEKLSEKQRRTLRDAALKNPFIAALIKWPERLVGVIYKQLPPALAFRWRRVSVCVL